MTEAVQSAVEQLAQEAEEGERAALHTEMRRTLDQVAVILSRWQVPRFPTSAGVAFPLYPRQDWQPGSRYRLVPATGTCSGTFRWRVWRYLGGRNDSRSGGWWRRHI